MTKQDDVRLGRSSGLGENHIPLGVFAPRQYVGTENMNYEALEIVISPGERDGLRILVLKGRLTIETVAGLQNAIRKENAPELIIDMAGVPSMDSAGLGVMIAAYVQAKKASRKLGFAGMNDRVKAVTDTSRLSQFLKIFATVKDAEAALASPDK